jgi:hypothetical protein
MFPPSTLNPDPFRASINRARQFSGSSDAGRRHRQDNKPVLQTTKLVKAQQEQTSLKL